MPEISVIIPVYNTEKYLPACLDSVLAQTFRAFELILVDDGSTDGSGGICDRYARNDPRVRVIRQPNAGQSAARNRGAAAAQTALLCLLDADDAVNPILLESLLRALREADAGMAVSARVRGEAPPPGFFDPVPTETETLTVDQDVLLRLFRENDTLYWTPFPCLVKKSVYDRFPLTEGRIMEDNAVACRWLCAAGTVARIRTPLYFYRENPAGTMNAPFGVKKLDYLWALEEQLACFAEQGFGALEEAVLGHYTETAVWFASRAETELRDPGLTRRILRRAAAVQKRYAAFCPDAARRRLLKASHPGLHRIRKKLRLGGAYKTETTEKGKE